MRVCHALLHDYVSDEFKVSVSHSDNKCSFYYQFSKLICPPLEFLVSFCRTIFLFSPVLTVSVNI